MLHQGMLRRQLHYNTASNKHTRQLLDTTHAMQPAPHLLTCTPAWHRRILDGPGRIAIKALPPMHTAASCSMLPHLRLYTSVPRHTTMLCSGHPARAEAVTSSQGHALSTTAAGARRGQHTPPALHHTLCTPMPPGPRTNAASTKLRATLQLPDSKQSWVAQCGDSTRLGNGRIDHRPTRAVM